MFVYHISSYQTNTVNSKSEKPVIIAPSVNVGRLSNFGKCCIIKPTDKKKNNKKHQVIGHFPDPLIFRMTPVSFANTSAVCLVG